MAIQLSPGVNFSEIDATNTTAAVGTSTGAFVGTFKWGPAETRVLIDSENSLVSQFGKPTSDVDNFTSFFSAANFLAYSNSLYIVRAANTSSLNASATGGGLQIPNESAYEITYNPDLGSTNSAYGAAYARYPGELGNSLTVSFCTGSQAFYRSGITANTVNGNQAVVMSANVNVSGAAVGDTLNIAGTNYTIASFAAGNTVNVTVAPTTTGNLIPANTSWKYNSLFNGTPSTSLYASSVGGSNDELHVVVIDTDGRFSGVANTILEVYPFVSKAQDAKTDDGSSNYYITKIFNASKYIYIANDLTGATNWGNTAINTAFNSVANYSVKLSGGTDGAITDADIAVGYDLFANTDDVDVSFIITGEASQTIQNQCLSISTQRKDCVTTISPSRQDAVNVPSATNMINNKAALSPLNSYGVMDSGYKYQFDKYNNTYRYVPLNADIAGLMARTDNVRDPWWSPAGFNRGQILNAVKLSWNPNKAERDLLYKNNINPVCIFPGEGIVLYGDKTLQQKASAFDRINVRRLFITLEKTISNAAKYALFEFNDDFTRAQFVSLVEPLLRDIKAKRGIYDYKVVCDTSNNTQQVIDTNQFIGDIYIKPAKSINFIQLNFVAVRTGVDFTEITGF